MRLDDMVRALLLCGLIFMLVVAHAVLLLCGDVMGHCP